MKNLQQLNNFRDFESFEWTSLRDILNLRRPEMIII